MTTPQSWEAYDYEFLSEAFTYKNHELLQALARGDDPATIARLRDEFASARRVLDSAYWREIGLVEMEPPDMTLRDYTPATDEEVRADSEAAAENSVAADEEEVV